jgi:ribonuclease D
MTDPTTSDTLRSVPPDDAVVPLTAPRDGLVPVTDRTQPLLAWCERAATAPDEPVAVDVERASSYRYSAKAYLIQVRTDHAGTALIDPVAFTLPPTFARLMAAREWVLHAATQDLPSLSALDLHPGSLFDTELAARLLGMERVGLGAVVEETLGYSLAKEHSAADWSRRPIPEPWLVYAALDVEVLVEVRDVLADRLGQAGKTRWAQEEFAHLLEPSVSSGTAPDQRWRKLHGLGALRSRRELAVARSLWERRDAIASHEDLSPHLVIKDKQLVAAAKAAVVSRDAFTAALPRPLRGKDAWWQAARSGLTMPDAHLPDRSVASYPPPHKIWSKKWPELWDRYRRVREAMTTRSQEVGTPTENLITPSLLRTWLWENEHAEDTDTVRGQLEHLGARPWQAEIVAPLLVDTLPA